MDAKRILKYRKLLMANNNREFLARVFFNL